LSASTPSTFTAAALRELVGADGVLVGAEEMAPFLLDHRHLYRGRAQAVVRPRDVEAVSRVLRYCHEHRIGVVPQGGNTSYCGGATPDESGRQIVLALARLDRIRNVDADNFSLVAEAGCILARVQEAAAEADRFFPLSLGAEGTCQIGGNLATNAGGLNVVRYGMTRELVLGVEAVLADGSIYDGLKSLRKDNTGYDLKSLLIGSEGTLGIITAASLKLWPQVRAHATAFIALTDVAHVVALLELLRAHGGDRISSFELLPRVAVELTVRHIPGVTDPLDAAHPWYVLCELTAARADEPLADLMQGALEKAMERGWVADAALAANERQRAAFWRLRESVPEAQRMAGPSLKHDIAVPVASLPGFIVEAAALVAQLLPDGVLVCYGHAGDGSLHFNVNRIDGTGVTAFQEREPVLRRAIHDLVTRFHGSISAEHGIGQLKREELARYASPVGLVAMRAIKQALDPRGILNPGKVL
jgi:FAD/FMN-containing dehydrogenase